MRKRGFEIAKGWEDRGIELPRRSTAHAAGYDIAAAEDITVPMFRPGVGPTLIPTGLKAYCQPDECYWIANRSSGAGKGIVMGNGIGLIDADYYENPTNDGHLYLIVFNVSDHELHIKKGDRIAQICFQKFLTVDDDDASGERQGGFGSTDAREGGEGTGENVGSRQKIRIIYDLDDVLWNLTELVMQRLGLADRVQTDFRVDQNTVFTDEEKKAILKAFGDAQNFADSEFYPGADEILDIVAPGVEVSINSNAYSPEVVAVKERRLRETYPDMPVELQRINLVTPSSNRKQIDPDVLVFVDDSPYNVAGSEAKFNLMPHKTWNTNPKAREVALGKNKVFSETWQGKLPLMLASSERYVIPVADLREVNDFIKQVIKLKQGTENE